MYQWYVVSYDYIIPRLGDAPDSTGIIPITGWWVTEQVVRGVILFCQIKLGLWQKIIFQNLSDQKPSISRLVNNMNWQVINSLGSLSLIQNEDNIFRSQQKCHIDY